MPYEQVRAIAVGCGGVASHMLRVLREKPWFALVAAVDVRREALEKVRDAEGLRGEALFTDLGKALQSTEANVALINTPSEWHYAQAQAILDGGLAPLVAKPVANRFADAVDLAEKAESRGIPLAVAQQIRFNRHYTALRRFMATGKLGEVEQVIFLNSKPRPQALNLARMSQPALLEMSCHHFDSLLSLFPDAAPQAISCDGFRPSWSPYAGPCMVHAWIRMAGGPSVLYHGGFSSQAEMYELRLEGTRGALRCRGRHMSNHEMAYEFAGRGERFAPLALDEGLSAEDPWNPFFDRWHAYLNGGDEPPFSGRNNLKAFALLSAGIESAEQGGAPVRIAGEARFAAVFDGERAAHG